MFRCYHLQQTDKYNQYIPQAIHCRQRNLISSTAKRKQTLLIITSVFVRSPLQAYGLVLLPTISLDINRFGDSCCYFCILGEMVLLPPQHQLDIFFIYVFNLNFNLPGKLQHRPHQQMAL